MIVMDTLILAIFAALLIYEQPAAKPDPELFSAQTREILICIYNTCIAITFYVAVSINALWTEHHNLPPVSDSSSSLPVIEIRS